MKKQKTDARMKRSKLSRKKLYLKGRNIARNNLPENMRPGALKTNEAALLYYRYTFYQFLTNVVHRNRIKLGRLRPALRAKRDTGRLKKA